MSFAYTIFSLGDAALTIDFGNRIDEDTNKHVLQLYQKLKDFSPSIIDLVPAYSSLTVYYDVLSLRTKTQSAFNAMKTLIEPLLQQTEKEKTVAQRTVQIPVCYDENFALDINEIAAQKNISVEEVIHLHTAKAYRVFMIGFLPGFAYMGKVDERLATPRKAQPRTNVAAGSVGIAGEQTGVYPLASPGGWNIIGRTPVKLFDPTKEESVLLQPGDEVMFYSITQDEFENYQSRPA